MSQSLDAGLHVGDELALLEIGGGQSVNDRIHAACVGFRVPSIEAHEVGQELPEGFGLLLRLLLLRECRGE